MGVSGAPVSRRRGGGGQFLCLYGQLPYKAVGGMSSCPGTVGNMTFTNQGEHDPPAQALRAQLGTELCT